MQNLDLSFAQDPNILVLALGAGLLPAILWILFFVRENSERPRQGGVLFAAFMAGVLMVAFALPVENFVYHLFSDPTALTVGFAASEEILKFLAFLLILALTSAIEVPIDYPVYMMVVALGFAGFENALYFLQPLQTGSTHVLILAGSMRFLGSTLMHAAVSSLAGIGLGFAFFGSRSKKILAALGGLALAVALHSLFNIFIPEQANVVFFAIIGSLWLVTIFIMMLLERLRERGSAEYLRAHQLGILSELEAAFIRLTEKAGMHPTDGDPILAGLTKTAAHPDGPEHAELSSLIEALRGRYTIYLVQQGAGKEDAAKAARTVIPETVSPKALGGIFSVLKGTHP